MTRGPARRWFAWTPSLSLQLGEELKREERRLIEAGSIEATGFEYVGGRSARLRAVGALRDPTTRRDRRAPSRRAP
jgi:hypothetical protein